MSEAAFVAHVSRAKVLRHTLSMLAAAASMAALAVTLLIYQPPMGIIDWLLLLLIAAVSLLFLYGTYWVGRSFFHRGEALVLDAEGMRMPGCFEGMLPWSAIARAQVLGGRVNLWLIEDAEIPPGRKFEHVLRSNRALQSMRRDGPAAPDVAISMWLANRRNSELVEAVRARAPQLFA
ncbi:hypothetical protein P6144_13150 [Sphingomonas sp. HITSZ_GF]|uniref:hypothetical protein n=1 Tax=Sphingomonas sp. HITSZ_GF TaxID=3037247 RepID=UPI00240DCBFE|nr:hypothetical protein [Sphingomonas sp. HITSZ_GF]MDG2534602.1 hypothetical protein [Sphingomonas sp. HITSZ_GF]